MTKGISKGWCLILFLLIPTMLVADDASISISTYPTPLNFDAMLGGETKVSENDKITLTNSSGLTIDLQAYSTDVTSSADPDHTIDWEPGGTPTSLNHYYLELKDQDSTDAHYMAIPHGSDDPTTFISGVVPATTTLHLKTRWTAPAASSDGVGEHTIEVTVVAVLH